MRSARIQSKYWEQQADEMGGAARGSTWHERSYVRMRSIYITNGKIDNGLDSSNIYTNYRKRTKKINEPGKTRIHTKFSIAINRDANPTEFTSHPELVYLIVGLMLSLLEDS